MMTNSPLFMDKEILLSKNFSEERGVLDGVFVCCLRRFSLKTLFVNESAGVWDESFIGGFLGLWGLVEFFERLRDLISLLYLLYLFYLFSLL